MKGAMGDVETEVSQDIDALGELDGIDPSLRALAIRLAQALDAAETDDRHLAGISKELRGTMAQLFANHSQVKENGLDLGLSS